MTPHRAAWTTVEVRVAASTSNLGPGFDFLGLALSLFTRVVVRRSDDTRARATSFDLRGSAVDTPAGAENLVHRAFAFACERLGASADGVHFEIDSEIPVARGLGSSGAAIAAGLLLANAIAARTATLDELLAWGLAIEGHPDNTSAALAGGCTLAVPLGDGGLALVKQPLHPSLGFALAWPHARLSTREARAVLPREVAFADAVENPRRLALLLEGLRTGDPRWLEQGAVDRLHVRHRLPLIAGGAEALDAARASGASLATISGSGSALVAIAPHAERERVAAAMRAELERHGPAEHRVVEPVLDAPRARRNAG